MADTPENQIDSEPTKRHPNDNVGSVVGPPSGAIPENPPTGPNKNNTNKKRQWTADPPMFWVTLAGVIAVVAYTSVAAWQVCIMRGQLDEMKTEQRPWVSIKTVPVSDLSVFKEGASIFLDITTKNVGNKPAMSIFPVPQIFPKDDPDINDFYKVQKRICNWPYRPGAYNILFPNDESTQRTIATFTGTEKLPNHWPPSVGQSYFFAYLIVCLNYLSAPGDAPHRTAILYELNQITQSSAPTIDLVGSYAN